MAVRLDRCVAFVAFAAALACAGCSDSDAIRVLDEPKSTRPAVPPVPADQKQYRTLAAMFPRDDAEALKKKDPNGSWWFFKLSGKTDAVAKHEADFYKLIDSVSFKPDADDPVAWQLPAGWTREAGGPARVATLRSPDGAAEVAVSQAGGVVLSNVQRWWGQLWGPEKATDVTAINLPDFTRQRVVNGRLIITVDLAGPKDPTAKTPGGPMMNPHGGM